MFVKYTRRSLYIHLIVCDTWISTGAVGDGDRKNEREKEDQRNMLWHVPFDKLTDMAIFNIYVSLPEGIYDYFDESSNDLSGMLRVP